MIDHILNLWNMHPQLYYGIIMSICIIATLWIGSLKSVRWEPFVIMPLLFFSLIWPIGIPLIVMLSIFVLIGMWFSKINGTNEERPSN